MASISRLEINAEGLLGLGREEFQDAARARAEIDQGFDPLLAEHGLHGSFHILFTDVQRAEFFPVGGIAAEIAGGQLGPLGSNGFKAGEIAGKGAIVAGQHIDDGARQGSAQAFFTQAEEHPIALLVARHQACFDHELEMAADARLALAQDLGEFADIEFAVGEDKENADAR